MRAAFIVGALLVASSAARAIDITTCGQVIPPRQLGVLQADLVCFDGETWVFNAGVTLDRGATLDLNGHTITMIDDEGNYIGVYCLSSCRVRDDSPGSTGRIIGIPFPFSSTEGIGSVESVRADGVDVEGFSIGIRAHRVRTSNVTIANSSIWGIYADSATLIETSISACTRGAQLDLRITAKDLNISDSTNGGIDSGKKINGIRVAIVNNGAFGVDGVSGRNGGLGKIKLRDSQVTGHSFDLQSATLPLLTNTTCGTSSFPLCQ